MHENEALQIIKFRLSPRRYQHSLGVAETARQLAECHQIDSHKAYLSGILHDYAKGIPGPELLAIAEANHLLTDEVERLTPDLLHAPVGAYLLRKELDITDEELLAAIAKHTLGDSHMSPLEQVIFLADMIEPGRDYPGMERLSCLAFRDLQTAMVYAFDLTIRYCVEQGRLIHPRSVKVRNKFLLSLPRD